MKKIWFVYIVKCRDGTLYTGITNNLEQRISEHNRGRGCRYTRGRRPVSLMYVEEFPDRSSALKRESSLKGLSRRKKLLLIRGKLSSTCNFIASNS
ncbi:MAG: GIY-YIG nuclease family protein [Candidatus Tritonobacter lacicola]|nr:GIY-YIG nuclease family protein [Candidatus Tritonobacter lacicola]